MTKNQGKNWLWSPRRSVSRSGSAREMSGERRESQWSTGRVFALIFSVSCFLLFFVLYMQRQWRHPGQRVIALVHDGADDVRKPVTLVGLETASERLFVMPIPREQRIAVWGTSAEYPSDALSGYTQLERLRWAYFRLVLAMEYGVVIDGVVWTSTPQEGLTPAQLRGVAWKTLVRQAPTTLTYWDRFRWWQMLRGHRGAVDTLSVGNWLTSEGALDRGQYDRVAVPKLQDHQIRESRVSIAVLNASGQQGEATRLGRLLERSGYDVRAVDTLDSLSDVSKIEVSPDLAVSETEIAWALQRLRDAFPVYEWEQNEETTRQRRVDVVITLGRGELPRWQEDR